MSALLTAKLRDRNAGQFESARSGFADYARDGESARELCARGNRTILEDLEAKVTTPRTLHSKLRDAEGGPSFGEVVARSRPPSQEGVSDVQAAAGCSNLELGR